MVKIQVVYEGDLHTQVMHEPSGQTLHTDAPTDHQGKGRTFSPTDLLAAALASCIATVMGIYAERKKIDLRGMHVEIEKQMTTSPPRRIERLIVQIEMPLALPQEEREKLEHVAHTCPVHKSLHPEIDVAITFHWKEE